MFRTTMAMLVRRALSTAYGGYMAMRNRRFDGGKGVLYTGIPVISVGNLSTGGTGKSPLVVEIARMLCDDGRHPVVVSRGYGRSSRGICVVHSGTALLAPLHEAGDELTMIARILSHCVIVAAEQRYEGIMRAIRLFNVDVAVIDDGFQHRRCARDCDIVIVDRSTLNQPGLLPLGLLREPFTSLSRASLICCTVDVREEEIRQYTDAPIIHVSTSVDGWLSLHSGILTGVTPPKTALLVCGIAHPERVRRTCEEYHVNIDDACCFPDHHDYSEQDVREILSCASRNNCSSAITTEKDLVKLERFAAQFADHGVTLFAPRIRTVFDKPDVLRSALEKALLQHGGMK
jgi:tetraacyldisaccharide 4'-kinase